MLFNTLETGLQGSRASLDGLVEQILAHSADTVEAGSTLPPRAYRSDDFLALETEALFKRDWLCVGHVSQVANVGDYFTLTLFDEPMIIVKNKEKIRALSSICRHRWSPVATGSGNARAFSCPFHKWTYGLDGKLIGAPLMDKAVGFDKKACRLPEFRCEVVDELGLIFVTFSADVSSINERLLSLRQRASERGWTLKDQVVVDTQVQTNAYNWKVQAETYAECYHHIGGHEHSIQRAIPASMTSCEENKGAWTVCNARLTDDANNLSDVEQQVYNAFATKASPGEVIAEIMIIFPLTLLSVMKDGCDLRLLQPLSPTRTRSVTLNLRSLAQRDAPDFKEWLLEYNEAANLINMEDNDINDMQQLGVMSEHAQVGRFSHLEGCPFHLAQYIRRGIRAYSNKQSVDY